ncbi:MAG: type IX secretion system outer membrane channel protein PorV, partial [Saprospiraceae bacterium]|nr:type IX secretion system outer membrane channel protein PorV [Saprospiraceae bacterium]
SLGEINFTDFDGQPSGTGKPREIEFAVSYNRKLSENFSMGLSAKYIYSNLASGQQVQGVSISSANAFAADLSFTYKKKGNLTAFGSEWTFGGALTNLGSKVTYTRSQFKDFLPANLGLGAGLLLNLDDYNSMSFHLDVNKLLVPSPQSPTIFDENENEIINPDYDSDPEDTEPDYKQQSNFGAMINSFGDAQGGFSEELKEYNFSLGVEYWYNKQFAVRTGYYYEHEEKGDRQFLTVGLGLKYNVFAIDISYLVPTNNRRNPLDNTLRFTLQFDFEALTGDYSDEN